MASSSQNGNGIIAGINVTPLVDITLVLLIIFIVTAKIIVTPAVPLDLPHATQSEQLQVVFSVILPVNGPTLVNGEAATTDDAVRSLARGAIERDPETRAVINADGSVPHRRVIELLDVLKSAGVAHIAFGALPPEPHAK
jgi:biopolymer transport protein TolR